MVLVSVKEMGFVSDLPLTLIHGKLLIPILKKDMKGGISIYAMLNLNYMGISLLNILLAT
jgi:hypothetical protein